jgi:hypothetical protein
VKFYPEYAGVCSVWAWPHGCGWGNKEKRGQSSSRRKAGTEMENCYHLLLSFISRPVPPTGLVTAWEDSRPIPAHFILLWRSPYSLLPLQEAERIVSWARPLLGTIHFHKALRSGLSSALPLLCIHVHLEHPFAGVIKLRWYHTELEWALNPVTGILVRTELEANTDLQDHTKMEAETRVMQLQLRNAKDCW